MGRSEVGFANPPLRPRLVSRESAEFSRAELSPIHQTEIFRTGPEGLFAAVRSELSQRTYSIPEVRIQREPNQPLTVVIASNNNIKSERIREISHSFPVDVVRIPEAEELHTTDSIVDATSKALDAARIITESEDTTRRTIRQRPFVTMATDQLNAVPAIVEDPLTHRESIRFERLGKPERENPADPLTTIRTRFRHLADMAQEHNWPVVPYIIELATVVHNPQDPDNNAVSVQRSVVFLSVDGLSEIATDRFDEYVDRVKEQINRTNKKKGVTDIAGGLELQVLQDMGVVRYISGTQEEAVWAGFPPPQRPEAIDHAYALALGHADEQLLQEYLQAAQQ